MTEMESLKAEVNAWLERGSPLSLDITMTEERRIFLDPFGFKQLMYMQTWMRGNSSYVTPRLAPASEVFELNKEAEEDGEI